MPTGDLHVDGRRRSGRSRRPAVSLRRTRRRQALSPSSSTRTVTTKDPAKYKIVGKSVPRLDIPDKIIGRFTYMQDFRVPGMLHGRVVRPPAIGRDAGERRRQARSRTSPACVKVVREGNFLGVVAESEWGAIRRAQAAEGDLVGLGGLPDRRSSGSTSAPPRSRRTT